MNLWLQNLVAHGMQALVLVAAGAVAARLLRGAEPWVRLALWQALLLSLLVLPLLQPWIPGPLALEAESSGVTSAFDLAVSAAAGGLPVDVATVVLVAVLFGVAARLAWMAAGWVRLRRICHGSRPIASPPEAIRRAILDVGATADFLLTPEIGPVSFGFRRPRVLLPDSFSSLDERAQYLIARHELLHVKRRDLLQALAEEVAVTLLWFHPWAWWVRAHIRLAREQVVDRAVLRGGDGRDAYVRSLLRMAGHAVPALPARAAVPHVRELRDRIDALYTEGYMSRTRVLMTVAIVAVALSSLAILSAEAFPLRTAVALPALEQAQEDEVVTVGGDVQPPRKTKHVAPVYPPDAIETRIQGVVALEAIVGPDGKVKSAKVLKSVPELDAAALDAVLQWEFEPTYIKGKAVSVKMTVTINFTLN